MQWLGGLSKDCTLALHAWNQEVGGGLGIWIYIRLRTKTVF